ncbi:MAG: M3 family oligoendopeptidase [Clostridia bacterium]|nr:M3 family oligoendopeptidase [Clostridia bacterium]
MKINWDLSVFYSGFDDPAYERDMNALPQKVAELARLIDAPEDDAAKKIRAVVDMVEKLTADMERVSLMNMLTISVDAEHPQANAAQTPMNRVFMAFAQCESSFARYLASVADLDAAIASDEELARRGFVLREYAQKARHQLNEAIEGPVLRMQLSGGKALSQLRGKLEATLTANYRGEEIPLSAVRGKAYDPDPQVRRDAYEAEIACYSKVEIPMAVCLNSIKAEGQTMAELRGYEGVLDMTLADSRLGRKTLEAMWTAIAEALPELRKYFKAKGRLLGHENGLPFYDLFAPVGSSSTTYTIEQARALLLEVFEKFTPEMSGMMARAFDEGWIDVFPQKGKRGGAFCAGCYEQNISRIMTNFSGSLSDVSTLAHELGHAFNNQMLSRVPVMMTDTPMPLAETASTFNETLLSGVLMEKAERDEEMMLLDASLTENTQVMVDIYSRFLFEEKVVAAQADHALSVQELKDTMLWAQAQSYGDGLDPDVRHPYMWACKSHYYSTGRHFYNFPYAFGGLFGRGPYARYKAEGQAFVPVYCDLLSRFGSDTIENVTASVGIDVTTPDFWREAVATVVEEAQRFAQLVEEELK